MLRDTLNAYLTLPHNSNRVNADDFHAILRTLQAGIVEGKSDDEITEELVVVLMKGFDIRSVTFRKPNIEAYSHLSDMAIAALNRYVREKRGNVLTVKNFVRIFKSDHKNRTGAHLSQKSGIPGKSAPLIEDVLSNTMPHDKRRYNKDTIRAAKQCYTFAPQINENADKLSNSHKKRVGRKLVNADGTPIRVIDKS